MVMVWGKKLVLDYCVVGDCDIFNYYYDVIVDVKI